MKACKYRKDIPQLLREAGLNGRLMEVGVWKGEGLALLGAAEADELIGIDIFEDLHYSSGDERWKMCCDVIAKMKETTHARLIKARSDQAWMEFESLSFDFIYIDADHRYDGIKKDIALYWPLVKKGGILAGHDYKVKGTCGVIQAVNEFVDRHGLHDCFHVTEDPVRGWTNPSWMIWKADDETVVQHAD